ncbi:MAG: hypothetical protein ABI439_10495 [Rhodospirillales bacterium]
MSETDSWLAFTVIGAGVTTVGSLIAMGIKEFFATAYLEKFKARQSASAVYRKFRDPISLSAQELCSRLREILIDDHSFLDLDVLNIPAGTARYNTADDPQYRLYKFHSTLYRFCSLFGWFELYRQELTFLDAGNNKQNAEFDTARAGIRSALADGHITPHDDWEDWEDRLILREEQRAIGEMMFADKRTDRRIVSYGEFVERFFISQIGGANRWFEIAKDFFGNYGQKEKDFRTDRLWLLLVHLLKMLEATNSALVTERLTNVKQQALEEIRKRGLIPDLA